MLASRYRGRRGQAAADATKADEVLPKAEKSLDNTIGIPVVPAEHMVQLGTMLLCQMIFYPTLVRSPVSTYQCFCGLVST